MEWHCGSCEEAKCADFHVEELEYRAEDGGTSQAWVPLRLIRPKHAQGPLPAVIYLHATGARTPLPSEPAWTGTTSIAAKLSVPCKTVHLMGHGDGMLKAH